MTRNAGSGILLQLRYIYMDVVEWSRALDVRLSETINRKIVFRWIFICGLSGPRNQRKLEPND
jgi:hypothetical protein